MLNFDLTKLEAEEVLSALMDGSTTDLADALAERLRGLIEVAYPAPRLSAGELEAAYEPEDEPEDDEWDESDDA